MNAILEFAQKVHPNEPVVMLNLLKFKPNTGQSGYAKYGELVQPLLQKIGGRVLFSGKPAELLLGHDQDWDLFLLVQYPSRNAFIQMITSEEYRKIQHHRDNSLTNSVLLAVDPSSKL